MYTIFRRLLLTSVPVGLPHLYSSTIFVVIAAMFSLEFERSCHPYCDAYLGAFAYVLHWQILLLVFYLLLLDADITPANTEEALGVVLMVCNVVLVGMVVIDARAQKQHEEWEHMLIVRKDQTIAEKEEQLQVLETQLLKNKVCTLVTSA